MHVLVEPAIHLLEPDSALAGSTDAGASVSITLPCHAAGLRQTYPSHPRRSANNR